MALSELVVGVIQVHNQVPLDHEEEGVVEVSFRYTIKCPWIMRKKG